MSRSEASLERLKAGGYLPPSRRDSCGRCAYGRIVMEGQLKRVACMWHGARTATGGYCPEFKRQATHVPTRTGSCDSEAARGLGGGV